jgi:hypothetical protein
VDLTLVGSVVMRLTGSLSDVKQFAENISKLSLSDSES